MVINYRTTQIYWVALWLKLSKQNYRTVWIYSDNGKRDEISAILKEAIDNADLSYTFSEKECDNYARYLIDKMNDVSSTWKKSKDNWDKFEEILVDYKKVKSKFGSSDKEMTRLKESLKKSFYVKANSYTWVFGD